MVLLLHPTSCQPSLLLPVCHWDHLEVRLVPHDVVDEVELGARSVGGSRGWLSAGLGGTPQRGGLQGEAAGTCPFLSGISHWHMVGKSQARPSGKYSQLWQQGVLEEGRVVPR